MQGAHFYGLPFPVSANGTLTPGQQVRGGHITSLFVPSTWTAAVITFDGAYQDAPGEVPTSVTWFPLIDDTGAEISVPVSAGKATIISPIKISGVDIVRIRSGTLAAVVSQTTSLTVIARVRAYE